MRRAAGPATVVASVRSSLAVLASLNMHCTHCVAHRSQKASIMHALH